MAAMQIKASLIKTTTMTKVSTDHKVALSAHYYNNNVKYKSPLNNNYPSSKI